MKPVKYIVSILIFSYSFKSFFYSNVCVTNLLGVTTTPPPRLARVSLKHPFYQSCCMKCTEQVVYVEATMDH